MGLDEAAIAQRKALLDFTEEDVARLKRLGEALRDLPKALAQSFYDHQLRFCRRLIPAADALACLREAQALAIGSLTAGDYGWDHVRDCLRAGIAYERAGLAPPWYLAASGWCFSELLPELWRRLGKDPQAFIATARSLVKALLLDAGLAIDAYRSAASKTSLALEQQLGTVFANAPVGLLVLSRQLDVLSANPAFLAQFGLDQETVRNRPLAEVVEAEGLEARALDVLESGISHHDVPLSMGASGSGPRKPVRVTLAEIRSSDDEDRLVIIVKDASEEERLREQARSHEARYRDLVDGLDAIAYEADAQTLAFTFVSRRAEAMLGYPLERWLSEPDFWVNLIHPDDREHALGTYRRAAAEAIDCAPEYRVIAADGRIVWLRDRVRLIRNQEGRVERLRGVMVDTTERRRAEDWQRHYARTLDLLTAGAPLSEVLKGIAGFVEGQTHGALCSILQLSADGSRLVHGAAPSLPDFYNRAIDGVAIGQGVGSCGTAAFTGRTVIVEDVLTHPYWADYRDLATRAGLRACWSEPIISGDDKVLGTFAVYHREPRAPTPAETALIRQAAKLAAIAIERAQQQEAMQLASVVFEEGIEGIMITDASERIVRVNRAFTELTGYSPPEVIGRTPRILNSGRHDATFFQALRERLEADGRWQGEIWNRRKSGEIHPVWMSIATVRDPQGAVSHHISILVDISEQKAQAAKIERLAFYDPLTGLSNRPLLLDRLRQALANARRHGKRVAVLFLDLDRFKEINGTQGHAGGDRALVEIARRLQATLRKEETLARLAGDEFVVIAIETDQSAAALIAERLQKALAGPLAINGRFFTLKASIGIAYYPEDGASAEELLKNADIAMYRAKTSGGGYRFYRPEMGVEVARTREIAHRLEAALATGGLQLHYQPQVHLPSGAIVGAEALARWHDTDWGTVSPGEFIPIAEERGLISALGDWALSEACRQLRDWQEKSCALPGRIAVNVSARQFEDDDFIDRCIRIPREARVSASAIELELTESGMMRDPERAVEVTRALAAARFSLSIDDFGTGYSSLAYLKRFPVHKLKIDGSFVRDILNDRNDYSIVGTIIAMGKSMKLATIAEGVECAKQVVALLSLGCQLAQGYYLGRPEPAEEFARRWLQTR